MDSRQAGNGGRLLTQQVISSVVYELPVQRKLLEWQVGKQPVGSAGWLQSLAGSVASSRVSSCVCVCVCVCVWCSCVCVLGGGGLQAECA